MCYVSGKLTQAETAYDTVGRPRIRKFEVYLYVDPLCWKRTTNPSNPSSTCKVPS